MSDAFSLRLPDHLEAVHRQVVERLAGLLEDQLRTHRSGATTMDLIEAIQREVADSLELAISALDGRDADADRSAAVRQRLRQTAGRCRRLDATLALLFEARRTQWGEGRRHLQQVLLEFRRTVGDLAGTLVEKSLLERQSAVLERIILSHEKISQWKTFVREILVNFQAVFPFDCFFVAIAEEHGLSLNLYYVGDYPPAVRHDARTTLARRMLDQLKLPPDAPLDIEEFVISSGRVCESAADIKLITVAVPDLEATNLAGLLGVAYARKERLTEQEHGIIRSVLAVMLMVVGSSKVLSRTLAELEYYAVHDPLTGLFNRRQFNHSLGNEIARAERNGHEFSILLLDLDDFKDINDTYGQPCGDAALKRVAETVTALTRKGDLTMRIGGDEFAVLMPETGRAGALVAAETLRSSLREMAFDGPGGRAFHVTGSIGVVTYPGDARSFEDLIAGVDIGLYRAKQMGKDGVCTLDAVGNRLQAQRRARDDAEKWRTALKDGRIVPYFQPIFDCRTGKVFAYETLARLIEPDGTTLPAGAFIETMERYGLGREVDRTIIAQAMGVSRERMAQAAEPVRLFINLSAQEIQERGVLGYAEEVCNRLGIPPQSIVFEILERDAIGDMTHMRKFLSALRERGFLFALDDFGSGYNSFHYLRELRFDFVKIDGAFVRNILASRIDYALVRNLNQLCRDIGIRTVAEYVESAELWDALRAMEIDYAQGFHLGLPTPRMP